MEDDEAASGAPEWFAFRQTANVAQAFGHDAAGMGEISMPIPAHSFKGTFNDLCTIVLAYAAIVRANSTERGTGLSWAPQKLIPLTD